MPKNTSHVDALHSLEDFAEKLLKEKGTQGIESTTLEQLKKDLLTRLEDRINATVVAALSPQQLEEFEKMLDGANEKKLRDFAEKHVPDLDQRIASQLLEFRATYLTP
jgi:hypothetical protein